MANATSLKFEQKPSTIRNGVNYDTRRVYLDWYWTGRWTYLHASWHVCRTPRADGRHRYYWLALGPFDLRVHP